MIFCLAGKLKWLPERKKSGWNGNVGLADISELRVRFLKCQCCHWECFLLNKLFMGQAERQVLYSASAGDTWQWPLMDQKKKKPGSLHNQEKDTYNRNIT